LNINYQRIFTCDDDQQNVVAWKPPDGKILVVLMKRNHSSKCNLP